MFKLSKIFFLNKCCEIIINNNWYSNREKKYCIVLGGAQSGTLIDKVVGELRDLTFKW